MGYAGFLRADEILKIKVCDVKIIVDYIEITSWLVSAYDFYSRVVKDR